VEFIIGRGDAAVIGEIGLTPRAKKVIELAIDEARRLNHDYIGTEHLLLGVVREGQGIAAGVLESLGVNLEKIRHQVLVHLESARQGDQPVRIRRLDQRDLSRKFSARSRRVLVFARDEALSMQHGAIDSGHFLIGFLREGEGIAARVLIDSGVEIQRLRALLSTRIVQRPGPKKDFDLTDRSAAELTMSMRLADQQQCTRVGTGHMLLAICTVELEAPTNFLADLGFDPDRLRHEVSMLLED
jgi:ATP-dependent Clp protease ATP-binding subunit ClpA